MNTTAFQLREPAAYTTSTVFATPHSGRNYPAAFLAQSVLDMTTLRSSEDAFVEDLVSDAPRFGAPLLAAMLPRAYVDLNRSDAELDPALIADLPRRPLNPRVASGLGVIPRVVSNGRAIYRGKISEAEAAARIRSVWQPYHSRLQGLLAEQRMRFGQALLIDCHSMPHEAIETCSPRGGRSPEVVLGDRFGAACAPEIMEQVEAVFRAEGLRVARNAPFAGAFVAQHYGRPSQGLHVVQIEIDRALYMDEASVSPHEGYEGFRMLMQRVVARLAGIGATGRRDRPLAAE